MPEKTEIQNVFRCRRCEEETGSFYDILAHEKKKLCPNNYSKKLKKKELHEVIKDEEVMGCMQSRNANGDHRPRTVRIKKPEPWNHTEELTRDQLNAMRDEFWDTAPHYGGKQEIWDALEAAAESEIQLAQTIVSCAGIIVTIPDMTLCFDERGAMYELPLYVLSDPENLIQDQPDN